MSICKYPGCTEDETILADDGYCIFHTTKTNADRKLFQQFQSDLNNKINRIEATDDLVHNYEGYIFPKLYGYFDSKEYKKPFNLRNTKFLDSKDDQDNELIFRGIFKENVDCTNAIFDCKIKFDAHFEKDAILKKVEFRGSCEIISTFEDKADFSDSSFKDTTKFEGTRFFKDCIFKKTVFQGNTTFNNVRFGFDDEISRGKGEINFYKATFENEALFDGVSIYNNTYFDNAVFLKNCKFNNLNLHFDTSFEKTKFLGDKSTFENLQLGCNQLNFSNAEFKSNQLNFIDFKNSGSKSLGVFFNNTNWLAKKIKFEKWNLESTHNIDFRNSKFKFDEIRFNSFQTGQGKLDFDDATFDGKDFLFSNNKLSNNNISFVHTKFLCEVIDFQEVEFKGSQIKFFKTQFGILPENGEENNTDGSRILFNKAQFNGETSFDEAKFNGKYVNFDESIFSNILSFTKAELGNNQAFLEDINFYKSRFTGELTNFSYSKFYSQKIDFKESKFDCIMGIKFNKSEFHTSNKGNGNDLIFDGAQFSGKNIIFRETLLLCKNVSFMNTIFGLNVLFDNTKLGLAEHKINRILFYSCEFEKDITFYACNFYLGSLKFNKSRFAENITIDQIHLNSNIIFDEISLSDKTNFYINNPKLYSSNKTNNPSSIQFKNIIFNPIKTFFKDISPINIEGKKFKPTEFIPHEYPYISFYNCHLDKVIFEDCSLAIFSFFTSYFELARFITCNWGETKDKFLFFSTKRKRILLEEFIHSYRKNKPKEKIDNEDENLFARFNLLNICYDDIANMYRGMKVASDITKDFSVAGDLYYNEYEMRRKHFINEGKKSNFLSIKYLDNKIKAIAFRIYKSIAGYGEKPFRSFVWFLIFLLIFGIIHLFVGFKVNQNDSYLAIDYNWNFSLNGLANIFSCSTFNDFCSSLLYSLTKIIFRSYEGLIAKPWEFLLSLVNSLTLILILTFFINGIRRKFKRY